MTSRPDLERELAPLKDFQLATVDRVHSRFWHQEDPVRRFLVADEVGLGKTMIARGVVAKTIDHLWETVERIDVVYICSNTQIARQNLARLREGSADAIPHADRLTMLPRVIGEMQRQKVNFISFTPGTSFHVSGSGGWSAERVLIYWMLADAWGTASLRPARWRRFFEGSASRESFERQLKAFDPSEIPQDMSIALGAAIDKARGPHGGQLKAELEECVDEFNYLRRDRRPPADLSSRRYALIGKLRHLVAAASVHALEPDLVILDEFQRFKNLMDEQAPGADLAHALFNYDDARLLLLSATPYKMYTLPDEPEGDDHYEDFERTVTFLAGPDRAAAVSRDLATMRTALYTGDLDRAAIARDAAQSELRRVMTRTERLASTPDRDGMIGERSLPGVALEPADVRAFRTVTAVNTALGSQDMLEYWRSAPYLLELMDKYKVKVLLERAVESGNAAVRDSLMASTSLLSWADIQTYKQLDPANAKMRGLVSDVLDRGAWRLAWLPPSMPYYRLAGAYADPDLAKFTKRLVFSAWNVVPKAISVVLSYEAERRLTQSAVSPGRDYDSPRTTGLLTFQLTSGRLTGMPVLGILYPCVTLATAGDPLNLARTSGAPLPLDRALLLAAVQSRVEELLSTLPAGQADGPVDESWYWAAPILFDRAAYPEVSPRDLSWGFDGDPDDTSQSRFSDHVERAATLDPNGLGRRPHDLAEVLTLMAVASPGAAALRAIGRMSGDHDAVASLKVRTAASCVAWALRRMFNRPEIMAMVRNTARSDDAYWLDVLRHCVDGCLSAVLDEFAHVLLESEGLLGKELEEVAMGLAEAMDSALSLRATTNTVHIFDTDNETIRIDQHRLRTHLAVRFGRGTAEDEQAVQRESQVRAAYNSPFWPFVLASTSVGQEGLDFHLYSHAIVHWNLPSNPVDLEQREGRVHRYKSHAVRRNIATAYGDRPEVAEAVDPWALLFELAAKDRPQGATEIHPYWVFPLAGGAQIERYTPVMPLSKETYALRRLLRTVAAYRLVIGQPRQEDLLRYLGDNVAGLSNLQIDLSPGGPA